MYGVVFNVTRLRRSLIDDVIEIAIYDRVSSPPPAGRVNLNLLTTTGNICRSTSALGTTGSELRSDGRERGTSSVTHTRTVVEGQKNSSAKFSFRNVSLDASSVVTGDLLAMDDRS